jgi:hypothetical protein
MADETVFTDLGLLDDHLHKETVRRMNEEKVSYRRAMEAVRRENPRLICLREALYRQRESGAIGLTTWRLIDGKLIEIDSQIEDLTRKAQAAHPELGYRECLRLVAGAHRDLFCLREYTWRVLHG